MAVHVNEFGIHYLTHRDNLNSILHMGIFANSIIRKSVIPFTDISDPEVQRWRERPDPILGNSIHDYVPLYLNPTNAMLYSHKEQQRNIVILTVCLTVTRQKKVLYADGNAASRDTRFSVNDDILAPSLSALRAGPWQINWRENPDAKRRRMAEVLIYKWIDPTKILQVTCQNNDVAQQVRSITTTPVLCNPKMYY